MKNGLYVSQKKIIRFRSEVYQCLMDARLQNLNSRKIYKDILTSTNVDFLRIGQLRSVQEFMVLLESVDIADFSYQVNGTFIWLHYGIRIRDLFITITSRELEKYEYLRMLFPNLINSNNFLKMCNTVHNFSENVFNVTQKNLKFILKPTGETSIYPTFSVWAKKGKSFPFLIYQYGPFFRYKSKVNSYLYPIESSFMLEAHGSFESKDEALRSFRSAGTICDNWVNLLCLKPIKMHRPKDFNNPVSEMTVGYDVVMPSGKMMQTAVRYYQGQIFSNVFNIKPLNSLESAHQITFGISERNILTTLYLHADCLGLRLPICLTPYMVHIFYNREIADKIEKICSVLSDNLIKVICEEYSLNRKCMKNIMMKGVPVILFVGFDSFNPDNVFVIGRSNLSIRNISISNILTEVHKIIDLNDAILKSEQSEILSSMHYAETIYDIRKNVPNIIFIHNDNLCIKDIQNRGGGEVIGFADENYLYRNKKCLACGITGLVYKACLSRRI